MSGAPVVHSHPEIVSGEPVFVGTRVPARSLVEWLVGGRSLDEFLDNFPSVTREQAIAFLEQMAEAFLSKLPADLSKSASIGNIIGKGNSTRDRQPRG